MKTFDIRELMKYGILFSIIFLFFFIIPPIDPITPKGMQMIGIFIAMLFGWACINTTIVSIIGIIALSFADGMTLESALASSIGQPNVMLMLMLFLFIEMCRKEEISRWIAGVILSQPIFKGHPLLLSGGILLVADIIGIINSYLSIMLMWTLVYAICDEFNVKPYEKYATIMLSGIALFSSLGLVTLPFQDTGLILTSMFQAQTGETLSYLRYLAAMLPLQLGLITIWMLGSKYLLHVDFDKLSQVDKTDLKVSITKRQKATLWLIALLVFLFMLSGNGPADWKIVQLLKQFQSFGLCCFVLFVASLWRVDDKPMLDFVQAAKDGVMWSILFFVATIMVFAAYLTAPDTGITAFIITYLGDILQGLSPWTFMVLTLLITFILTNIVNNIIVGSVVISLLVPMSQVISFNLHATVTMVIMMCSIALLTPASSGTAPLLYGNKEWIKVSSLYQCMLPLMLACLAFILTVGIAWANFCF